MRPIDHMALFAAGGAALEHGLLAALPGTAAEIAARTQRDARAIALTLDVLVARDILVLDSERYTLAPHVTAALARAPGGSVAAIALFSHLGAMLRTGKPIREMDGDDATRMASYQTVARDLGEYFAPNAARLASELAPVRGTILDIGAGSAVWSCAVAAASPDARVIAVDLPAVVERAASRAEKLGIAARVTTIAGNWFEVELPAADVVVLANVLHLEEAPGARRLLARAAEACAPDSRLVIIDMLDGEDRESRIHYAAYQLHLGLRTRAGRAHSRAELTRWLGELGFVVERELDLAAEDVAERALVAKRAT